MEYNKGEVGDLVRCGYAGIWEITAINPKSAGGPGYLNVELSLLCNSKFRFAKKRRKINVAGFWKLEKEDIERDIKFISDQLNNVKKIRTMFK